MCFLDPSERMRWARFRRDRDRMRFLVSHVLVRAALGEWVNGAPEVLRFEAGPYGKPRLAGAPRIHFNLSHSHDRIALAVARDREVGVDVERVLRIDVLGLARRFFSRAECAKLAATDPAEQTLAFYRCWTRKESFVKALGAGLSYQLSSFTVDIAPSRGQVLLHSEEFGPTPGSWTVLGLESDEEYVGSLALEGGSTGLHSWNVHVESDRLVRVAVATPIAAPGGHGA
jgi:4'-phosphopantetheinyl transferase